MNIKKLSTIIIENGYINDVIFSRDDLGYTASHAFVSRQLVAETVTVDD